MQERKKDVGSMQMSLNAKAALETQLYMLCIVMLLCELRTSICIEIGSVETKWYFSQAEEVFFLMRAVCIKTTGMTISTLLQAHIVSHTFNT